MRETSNQIVEVLSVLHWSPEALTAYQKALEAYERAGRPHVEIYKPGEPSNILRTIPTASDWEDHDGITRTRQ